MSTRVRRGWTKRLRRLIWAVVPGLWVGCAADRTTAWPAVPHRVSPALVLPAEPMQADAGASGPEWWAFGRNDPLPAVKVPPSRYAPEEYEIVKRDRLTTTNGHLREFSTSTVRSRRGRWSH